MRRTREFYITKRQIYEFSSPGSPEKKPHKPHSGKFFRKFTSRVIYVTASRWRVHVSNHVLLTPLWREFAQMECGDMSKPRSSFLVALKGLAISSSGHSGQILSEN
jgi:hypothetical protein